MTREYPPEVYGGAGVHVTELVGQLTKLCDVDVHCMGVHRRDAFVAQPDPLLAGANAALTTLSADLAMVNNAFAGPAAMPDVVHSHTWYTGMAGHLTALLHGIPHVLTAHSLEPRRPWKAEQLGGGYRISSWVERTAIEAADAVIAVSAGMRTDVLATYPQLDPARVHVVRNGIDTDDWYPVEAGQTLVDLGIDPDRPIAAFVGRITRQKGVGHLIAAAHQFDPDVQLVLCAGAPTPRNRRRSRGRGERAQRDARRGALDPRDAAAREDPGNPGDGNGFRLPSVYEPLGIVNLEAMACGTAVVASDVGGIPEVVDDGTTGLLVHYDAEDAVGFETGLADAVNAVVRNPEQARTFGQAGRRRCIEEFSWMQVAQQTLDIYRSVCG